MLYADSKSEFNNNFVVGSFSAPRGFTPGTPVFPSPQKPALLNSNSTRNARTHNTWASGSGDWVTTTSVMSLNNLIWFDLIWTSHEPEIRRPKLTPSQEISGPRVAIDKYTSLYTNFIHFLLYDFSLNDHTQTRNWRNVTDINLKLYNGMYYIYKAVIST